MYISINLLWGAQQLKHTTETGGVTKATTGEKAGAAATSATGGATVAKKDLH